MQQQEIQNFLGSVVERGLRGYLGFIDRAFFYVSIFKCTEADGKKHENPGNTQEWQCGGNQYRRRFERPCPSPVHLPLGFPVELHSPMRGFSWVLRIWLAQNEQECMICCDLEVSHFTKTPVFLND